jgi:hypothetical protein
MEMYGKGAPMMSEKREKNNPSLQCLAPWPNGIEGAAKTDGRGSVIWIGEVAVVKCQEALVVVGPAVARMTR